MPESERPKLLEAEREKVRELNRQLMVANADCEDLRKNLDRLGKMIYRRKVRIENLLDGKEQQDVE